MSENIENNENQETSAVSPEATIVVKISEQNLQYKSDFSEAETIFWLEAVKALILKKAFELAGLAETTK